MDRLRECAENFRNLQNIEYKMILGKKGRTEEINLCFRESDFHHLSGLQKLTDIEFLRSGNRSKIFNKILNGDITYSQIEKSIYFDRIEKRIPLVSGLENYLDRNDLIFKYNRYKQPYSNIEAKFLLMGIENGTMAYLFLDEEERKNHYFCRSMFPKEKIIFEQNQPRFSLLYKEKIMLSEKRSIVQMNRLK